MQNLPGYFKNSKVDIDSGQAQELKIKINDDHFQGLVYTHDYPLTRIRVANSYSPELNFFHASDANAAQGLTAFLTELGYDLHTGYHLLRVEHDNKVQIDPMDNSTAADGVIFTRLQDSKPIVLTPADCLGICAIDTHTGLIGLCHAGRSGIGNEIVVNFLQKVTTELIRTGSPLVPNESGRLEFIVGPHIFPRDFPHTDARFLAEAGWSKNKQFVSAEAGIFYPDIGGAGVTQIIDFFSIQGLLASIKIIATGLNTYGNVASYKQLGNNERNCMVVGRTVK